MEVDMANLKGIALHLDGIPPSETVFTVSETGHNARVSLSNLRALHGPSTPAIFGVLVNFIEINEPVFKHLQPLFVVGDGAREYIKYSLSYPSTQVRFLQSGPNE